MGTIPGRTAKGLKWYLAPDDPGVLRLPGWEALDDYQLCYWYCLEMERRRRHYESLFRSLGARTVAITLAELTTLSGFLRLRRDLGLPRFQGRPAHWYRYARTAGARTNTQAVSKVSIDIPDEILAAREIEVEKLVQTVRPPDRERKGPFSARRHTPSAISDSGIPTASTV